MSSSCATPFNPEASIARQTSQALKTSNTAFFCVRNPDRTKINPRLGSSPGGVALSPVRVEIDVHLPTAYPCLSAVVYRRVYEYEGLLAWLVDVSNGAGEGGGGRGSSWAARVITACRCCLLSLACRGSIKSAWKAVQLQQGGRAVQHLDLQHPRATIFFTLLPSPNGTATLQWFLGGPRTA